MKLIIEGDDNKVRRLEKELRLRIKRDGLKSSTTGAKKVKKAENIEAVESKEVKPVDKNAPPTNEKPPKQKGKNWFGGKK